MIRFTNNNILSRKGSCTIEGAVFLPLIILAVLTIGYFMKTDSMWETAFHNEIDRCTYSAAIQSAGLHTKHFEDSVSPALPLGFSRTFTFKGRLKYRDFIGKRYRPAGLGASGLQEGKPYKEVWIFPQSGIRYHSSYCTYVKANVQSRILTSDIKNRYSPCSLCNSEEIPAGGIVFCFNSADTAYHYGTCPSIKRHPAPVDREEAVKKGYTPCSKCRP